MQLFCLFWSFNILQDIMNETNRYAISHIFIYGSEIQNLAYYMAIYEHEATTEYEELLNERRFDFHCPTISEL
jgi:hypothetical protein